MPKRESRNASIEITCTPTQKAAIQARAKQVGAKSLSEYILTLALAGDTAEYGFVRRKAEGALINADFYTQLANLVAALEAQPDRNSDLVQQAIALTRELGREVALSRWHHRVEQVQREN